MRAKEVQEKYNIFMETYRAGVTKFVPKYKPREEGKQDWFNARCASAKERRDGAWKRWKRNRNLRNKKTSKQREMSRYMKVRKEEKKI